MKRPLLLLGFLLLVIPARAEAPADVEARMRADLALLTSEECEGRGITTKGINIAAEHIARQFQKAGLKPGGRDGTYFQPFTLTTSARPGPNNRITLQGPLGQTLTLEVDKHFAGSVQGSTGKASAGVVFAGYGITAPDLKYDDYANLDVEGKIVVFLTGTPRRGNRYIDNFAAATESRTSPFAGLASKLENAEKHKAVAVLVVNDASATRFSDSLRSFTSLRSGEPSKLPVANLSRGMLDRLLTATGTTLAQVEKEIDAAFAPRSLSFAGWNCQLETDIAHTKITVKNVVGVLEGQGALAKETIVIGAHYDHVGMGSTNRIGGPARTGVAGPGAPGGVGFPLSESAISAVYHGADDNASGSTIVMELARRFAKMPAAESRRVVFMTFTAEESGLIGSAYYCRNPLFPIADTTAMINMDMVGRLQDNKLLVGGTGSAKQFEALVAKLNEKHRFDLAKDPSGQGPSDHSSFYAQKIPVLQFFTGFHEQYHRPTDRMETINVPGMVRIADIVGDAAQELRTNPARPEYVKTGGFNRTNTLWSFAPSTGVMPDYTDKKTGLVVDSVVNNTAAAKAGLKKGDRIVAVAGKPIKDPMAFLETTRALKLGEKVELAVERNGKVEKLEFQVAKAPPGQATQRFGWYAEMTDLKDGLLLTDVPADSPAGKAGLKKGDRVVTIAGEEIKDTQALFTVIRALQPGEKVAVGVMRDGKAQQFQVQTSESTRPIRPPSD